MTADQVAVVGLWHLGSVLASGLASYGIDTIGLDRDETIIDGMNRGERPLFELGLAEAVQAGIDGGSLWFRGDSRALAEARFVWPAADSELGDNDSFDTGALRSLVYWFAPYVRPDAISLISSQVPIGTTESLRDELSRARPDWQPRVAYIPENLRLGSAIEPFHHPDWLVVGADDETAAEVTRLLAPIKRGATVKAAALLSTLTTCWPRRPTVWTQITSRLVARARGCGDEYGSWDHRGWAAGASEGASPRPD
ncbi:hypothetical protein ACFWDI_39445 [Streptomyces sp. NPDC060064]|uniref:hypothetical protein n=1 Tax=Streptomyces sp. NPDC060064 TaxID=3347049 RepID=UPI0036BC5617